MITSLTKSLVSINRAKDDRRILFLVHNYRAKRPTRGSMGAIGYDLSACFEQDTECILMSPLQRCKIPTGISVDMPEGVYGNIKSRSGLAWKKGLMVMTGTIDEDYKGQLFVMLFNASDDTIEIKDGECIAQIVFAKRVEEQVVAFNWEEKQLYEDIQVIKDEPRASAGFGSTDEDRKNKRAKK
jgi:dUTP pyrophosphatase